MKRILILLAVAVLGLFLLSGTVGAATFVIYDTDLQAAYFADGHAGTGTGKLNNTSDITGNPGTEYNVSFTVTSADFESIQIGDNFDRPIDNSGVVVASGNLSSYDDWTMTIRNPNIDKAFMVGLYLNTGWTDTPWNQTNMYYQETKDLTWVDPGSSVTLIMDFDDADYWNGSSWVTDQAVQYLNHVTDIGLIIGTNLVISGAADKYHLNSGSSLDVQVVPIPTSILLLGSGIFGLIGVGRFRFRKKE